MKKMRVGREYQFKLKRQYLKYNNDFIVLKFRRQHKNIKAQRKSKQNMSANNQGIDPKRSVQNVQNQPTQYGRQHKNQQILKQDHKLQNDQQQSPFNNQQFPNSNQLGAQSRTQPNTKQNNVGKSKSSNAQNTGGNQIQTQQQPGSGLPMPGAGAPPALPGMDFAPMGALPEAFRKQYEEQMKELHQRMMQNYMLTLQQQQQQQNGTVQATDQMENGHQDVQNDLQDTHAQITGASQTGAPTETVEPIESATYQNGGEEFDQENQDQMVDANLQDNESAGSYNDPGQPEDYEGQDYNGGQEQVYQEAPIIQNGQNGEEIEAGFSERSSVESQYYEDRNDLTVDHSQMCYDEPSQMHQEDGEFPYGSERQFEGSQQSQEEGMDNQVYSNDQNGYYADQGPGDGGEGGAHHTGPDGEQYYDEDEIGDENYHGDDNTYNYQDPTGEDQLSNECADGQYLVEDGFADREEDFQPQEDEQKVSSGANNSLEYGDENHPEYHDDDLDLKQGFSETGMYKFEEDRDLQAKPKQFLSQQSLNNSEQHINQQNEQYHTVDDNVSGTNYQESFGRYPQDKSNSVSAHTASLGGGSFGHQPAEKSHKSATPHSFSLGGGSACPAPAKIGGPGTTGNNTDQQCLSNGPSFGGFDGQCINGQEFDEDGNPHQDILGHNQLDLPSGSRSMTEDPDYQDRGEFQENQFDNEMGSSRVASCTDWPRNDGELDEAYRTDLELPQPFWIQRIVQHRYKSEEPDDLEFRCAVSANLGLPRREPSGDQEASPDPGQPAIGDVAGDGPSVHWIALSDLFGSEVEINRVHLKYYCRQNQILFDGIDEIEELVSAEKSVESGHDRQGDQTPAEAHDQKLPTDDGEPPNEHYEKDEDVIEKRRPNQQRRRKMVQSSSNSVKSDSEDVDIPNEPVSTRRGKANDAAREHPAETIKTRSGRISKRLPINMLTSTNDEYVEVRRRGRGAKANKRQRMVERDEDDEDYKEEEESPLTANSFQSSEAIKQSSEEEDGQEEMSSGEETKRGGNLGLGFHTKTSSSHQTERNAGQEVEGETKKRYSTRLRTRKAQNINKRSTKVQDKNLTNLKKLKKRNEDVGYNTQGYEDKEDLIQNDDAEADSEYEGETKLGWKENSGGKEVKATEGYAAGRPKASVFYGVQDAAEARKERARDAKAGKEMWKQKEVAGSFELGHEPMRIRSFHRKFPKKSEKQQMSQENMLKEYEECDEIADYADLKRHPYRQVTCTVEWHDMKEGGTKITVTDSRVPYWDLRMKAPHLLCDFFERHMQIV